MMKHTEPKNLTEAILFFSKPENCLGYLVERRWPNGVVCPTCGSEKVSFLENQSRWQCNNRHPKRQFSIKTGTIFEGSPLGLDKWLTCIWLVTNCKNGISSHEIARDIGVTQKTAWFMLHRIRLAHQEKHEGPMGGAGSEVETDETFIGGKARNMHKARRERVITGTGGKDKTVVMGLVERGGDVRAFVMDSRKKKGLQRQVREHVAAGSAIFSDELKSYDGLAADYQHAVINHAIAYVDGRVHTNTMENFWSLLKRTLHGTYVSVEPFHLFRYIDEQAFRYNHRSDLDDSDRFDLAVRNIIGKRLTYAELTGKVYETRTLH